MLVVHRSYETESEKPLTKKQAYHQRMVQALRRRQYQDFLTSLKDPQLIAAVEELRQIDPDFKLKFTD